jgi:protein-S-isoprenylcysteine O-methyltransferase Ste14
MTTNSNGINNNKKNSKFGNTVLIITILILLVGFFVLLLNILSILPGHTIIIASLCLIAAIVGMIIFLVDKMRNKQKSNETNCNDTISKELINIIYFFMGVIIGFILAKLF